MIPAYHDSQFTQWIGDNIEVMAEMPAQSVDAIMCSPPYMGLRLYKAPVKVFDNHNGCEHDFQEVVKRRSSGKNIHVHLEGGLRSQAESATKFDIVSGQCSKCGAWRGQLGCEPQPDLFIKHLCDTFDACRRVLKKTGCLWVNIKDSYWNAKGSCFNPGGGVGRNTFAGIQKKKEDGVYPLDRGNKSDNPDIPTKSLIGIPERFVLEMMKRGWIRRSTVIWHKRNVMPSSVKDRFTEDFEYLYMFTLSSRYFFEQQFEPIKSETIERYLSSSMDIQRTPGEAYPHEKREKPLNFSNDYLLARSRLGRNARTVWTINTVSGGRGVHFATFPPALCTTPILASVPEQICTKCGKPRVRIYAKGFTDHDGETKSAYDPKDQKNGGAGRLALLRQAARGRGEEYQNTMELVGLSDCGCGAPFEPGVILDPFGGSGTVALEARRLGRRAICIDISEEYSRMAVEKVTAMPNPFE